MSEELATNSTKSYCYIKGINYKTKIVYVGNLYNNISHAVLGSRLSGFGRIINIEMDEKGTFAFVEYILKTSVSNAISKFNGQMLKGRCLYLDYGTVKAPRSILMYDIPNSIEESHLISMINYYLSKAKLCNIRDYLRDETKGSILLFFNCDIHKAFQSLRDFFIGGRSIIVDLASDACMFTFGDFSDLTNFKAKTGVKHGRSIRSVNNEQCSTNNVDNLSSNSTCDPKKNMLEPAELENNNSVNNHDLDNSDKINKRSPKTPPQLLDLETELPINTISPRIRLVPLDQLTVGVNDVANHTSHASTDNCSRLLNLRGESLDSSPNKSIDQPELKNQESSIEQINKQKISDEYIETQDPTETIEQPNPSPSEDNIDMDNTDYNVDENKGQVINEEYEEKVIICKHIKNSTSIKNAKKNVKQIKRKENHSSVIKLEKDDEVFVKYESMYDKVKNRSNRNSLMLNKVKVKEEPDCGYSFKRRK